MGQRPEGKGKKGEEETYAQVSSFISFLGQLRLPPNNTWKRGEETEGWVWGRPSQLQGWAHPERLGLREAGGSQCRVGERSHALPSGEHESRWLRGPRAQPGRKVEARHRLRDSAGWERGAQMLTPTPGSIHSEQACAREPACWGGEGQLWGLK